MIFQGIPYSVFNMNNYVNAVIAHEKKKKNKYLLSKDQWNQNYYFTLFQSFISSMCGNFLLLVHELMSFLKECFKSNRTRIWFYFICIYK